MRRFFRVVGFLEALSFLLLLGVAMPLKYVWAMPLAVRIVGSLHGALFVLFCGALAAVQRAEGWPLKLSLMAFVSAFLPAGPLVFDRKFLPPEA